MIVEEQTPKSQRRTSYPVEVSRITARGPNLTTRMTQPVWKERDEPVGESLEKASKDRHRRSEPDDEDDVTT